MSHLQLREEYVVAGLRKQIAFLEGVLRELEGKGPTHADVEARLRAVEAQLKQLRGSL